MIYSHLAARLAQAIITVAFIHMFIWLFTPNKPDDRIEYEKHSRASYRDTH